jgi:hypothetical protein
MYPRVHSKGHGSLVRAGPSHSTPPSLSFRQRGLGKAAGTPIPISRFQRLARGKRVQRRLPHRYVGKARRSDVGKRIDTIGRQGMTMQLR